MKPLGLKNYGSIPHLIGSKTGPGDKTVHEGQHRICTEKVRDKYDTIVIQEKYDGSNVGIAKLNGSIIAITRSGYLADTSPYEQHHVFSKWVKQEKSRFSAVLNEGERIAGEWLYQAHGLEYIIDSSYPPFVAFDIFTAGNKRLLAREVEQRLSDYLLMPISWYFSGRSVSVESAFNWVERDDYFPIMSKTRPEGVIYRVERKGKVDFLAKYVRHDFTPGKFLTGVSGNPNVYNCEATYFLA